MRRRLLTSTLTIVIATVAVFGIPLGFVVDRVIHDNAQARLDHDAERVALELAKVDDGTRTPAQLGTDLQRFVRSEDRVKVQFTDGRTVDTGAGEREDELLSATVPGPRGSQVTVETPAGEVDSQVQHVLLVVAIVAVVALAGALALALWQSARLANPLNRLARSASRLGEGDFSLATPRSGVEEIDAIADSLDVSATRIDNLLRAERNFSSHASHQLRSALTGLQLRLDELATSDDEHVRAEAEAALEQSARLNAMVDELLALARTGRTGIVISFDLADLARKHAGDIRPVLARDNRRVVVDAPQEVEVVAAVGAVGQVLDILLSNAADHGEGLVTVHVRADRGHARLDVEDEGDGIPDAEVATLFQANSQNDGHGIGLVLARTLLAAEGGTVSLVRPRPPMFRVELPRGLTQS